MPPVRPSNLLLCSAYVRLRDERRITLEFEEDFIGETFCCGSFFVILPPDQSLLIYALLLTAYLFAICSTDLQYSWFFGFFVVFVVVF